MSKMSEEIGVYKDEDGSQHPDTIAMSIVYNLGDALYNELKGIVPAKYIVKARQATNDKFIDYATELIHSYTQEKCREVELKAQLGMIDYYDQAPTNESCNWKGLLSDNRKQIEYELAQLNKSKGE